MKAVQFEEFGGPEVLRVVDAEEPHAGPGHIRIVVRAASVNPVDWKIRSGMAAQMLSGGLPAIGGSDAAGVVDEVGNGADVRAGDEVFGLGSRTYAGSAVLRAWAVKPARLSFEEAAALAVVGETAYRGLKLLDLAAGDTILIDGAAGGVGSVAVQLANAWGIRVIGTASPANFDYLTSLGADPVAYGDGLADRVRALTPDGVAGVFDTAGQADPAVLIGLTSKPSQVVSIANFGAAQAGVQVTSGGGDARAALQTVAELAGTGKLTVPVQTYRFDQAGEAQRISQEGHVRGKLVLVP